MIQGQFYNRTLANIKYPKESLYYHLRYSVLNSEQDEEQLNHIIEHNEIEYYAISIIENEDSTVKKPHRHITIKFKNKKTDRTAKNLLIKNPKLYNKDDIYCKSKYAGSTLEQILRYTLKCGNYDSNFDDDLINSVCGSDRDALIEAKEEIDRKNKREKTDLFRVRFKHIQNGNIIWFFENDPKYILGSEFQRALVWAQKDKIRGKDDILFLQNWFIIDLSGTGKSSAVNFICCPISSYEKNKARDTFDGWNNHLHKNLIIHELDSFDAVMSLGGLEGIKQMGDYSPFSAKFMYANRNLQIRPDKIFITSNTRPGQLFNKDRHGRPIENLETHMNAFRRRFKIVNCNQFHNTFGLRLDKKINRIVFNFEGMKNKTAPKPNYEYFDKYLSDKFKNAFEIWKNEGEEFYIKWEKEQQRVNQLDKKIKKRKERMLIPELENLFISENIIEETDDTYNNLNFV